MGAFLQVGVCYNVCIFKEHINRQKLTFEDIEKALSKKLDLYLYDLHEFDNKFEWKLKEEYLIEDIHKFLDEQFRLFEIYERQDSKILDELKSLKSYEGIVQFAKKKKYENFQNSEIYEYLYCGTWRKEIMVIYNQITFFIEGKIIMEQYDRFLRYMEALIKNNSSYKTAKAVKAFIN